jgi:hypothetical protein
MYTVQTQAATTIDIIPVYIEDGISINTYATNTSTTGTVCWQSVIVMFKKERYINMLNEY